MIEEIQKGINLQTRLKGWCRCKNGEEENPDAYKLSIEFVHGEEIMKHMVSYYKCVNCGGLIKTEES